MAYVIIHGRGLSGALGAATVRAAPPKLPSQPGIKPIVVKPLPLPFKPTIMPTTSSGKGPPWLLIGGGVLALVGVMALRKRDKGAPSWWMLPDSEWKG